MQSAYAVVEAFAVIEAVQKPKIMPETVLTLSEPTFNCVVLARPLRMSVPAFSVPMFAVLELSVVEVAVVK